MSDWATVGVAAVTGGVGYLGARLQARTALRQADTEVQRLQMEHAEDHLRNRQTTYHLLLQEIRRLDVLIATNAPAGDDAFREFMVGLNKYATGAALFGTDEVRQAVAELHKALGTVGDTDDYYGEAQEALAAAYKGLLDAMRADVAPGKLGSRPRPNT